MNTDKFPDLVAKLKEIFQIDKPDLDFGIYRILNTRRREIEDFLDNKFKARVEAALSGGAADAAAEALASARAKVEGMLGADAIGPDGAIAPAYATTPVGVEYESARASAAKAAAGEDAESLVYSHLLAFFSRYYDDGDFISQRRYKDGVYAIPYSGEEVKLHWANADQYYTKTGENFTNYDFTLEGGHRVHFALVSADTAKDNAKDNDAVRLFVLWDPEKAKQEESIAPDDFDDAAAEEQPKRPSDFIEVKDGELFIYFQYLKFPKKTKKTDLLAAARAKILERIASMPEFQGLAAPSPTEKDRNRTVFDKHFAKYVEKNTSDYFIHKDLGAFLRRELDFYVKNEMMRLDEVDLAGAEERIAAQLRTIRTFRSVALDLIAFMAQLEDFQKKLWLKKKFVVQSDWCLTLDIVREHAPELLDEIFASDAQRAEWKRLGLPDVDFNAEAQRRGEGGSPSPATVAEKAVQGELNLCDSASPLLKNDDARMVDTKFFPPRFKARLLAAIPDLDSRRDGLLVRSENFQALRLMQERFSNKLDCIHIDPPYNTNTSGFLYKNNYQHSSWASMMLDRFKLSYKLLNDNGFLQCHIDENEYEMLVFICNMLDRDDQGTIIWDKLNPMLGGTGVATQHEYILTRQNNDTVFAFQNENASIIQAYAKEAIDMYGGVNDCSRKAFAASVNKDKRLTGGEKAYHLLSNDGQIYRLVAMGAPEKRTDPKYYKPLIHPITKKPCPVPSNGFSRKPETIEKLIKQDLIVFGKDETVQPQKKVFLSDSGTKQVTSVIQEGKSGKADLDKLGLSFPYAHPVELYDKLQSANNAHLFLDYFAGSGTTGHAVIDLNRQDGGKRKYILVEMGEHFETVLKPRIEKVVYSPDWKDGRPESADKGVAHCFQYLTLESYEDTLNNLELRRPEGAAPDLLGSDDYLLRYMLDVEARGSVLSTDDFRHPFHYALKIAVDSSGATAPRRIDLVETFNWLVGLKVGHVEDRRVDRSLVLVEGTLPGGETALVVWRDCDKVDNDALADTLKKLGYISKTDERPLKGVDTIFVNGDHALPAVLSGETGQTKVRSTEEAFLAAMFE